MLTLLVDQRMPLSEMGEGRFLRINDALDVIRAKRPDRAVVFVRRGEYYEKLQIDVPNVTLVGEDRAATVLTYNDHAAALDPVTGEKLGTANSQSVRIAPQGTGFSACSLTFRNHYDIRQGMKDRVVGTQMVALQVAADRCVFDRCDLRGVHDTLYTPAGRHYFKDCFVMGDVDFIFGASQSVFEGCELFTTDYRNRMEIWGNKGYVCAPNTPLEAEYGYLFESCRLTSDVPWPYMVYLGRCYGPHAAAAFLRCELGEHIRIEGFTWMGREGERRFPMDARFVEYGSTGPGAVQQSSPYRRLIDAEEAGHYTKEKVWGENNGFYPDRYDGAAQLAALREAEVLVRARYR